MNPITSGLAIAAMALAMAGGSAQAGGDAEAGAKVYKKCQACHAIEVGKNKVGPSLAGVVGRQAGTTDGYKYSDAMANSGVVWTEETLDQYLADPKAFLPGNKMTFNGLKKDADRANVIAYLQAAQ